LDHRTDIYSLGATLYELLTLQPPFQGVRRDQVIAQIIGKEPKPPRSINRRIPQDLETICLKMMEKDPDKRYQTASGVADDLRRYVSRFAISARRVGVVGRVVRWAKRNRVTAAALCGLLLLGLVAGLFAYRERVARQQVLQEKMERAMLIAMSGDLDGAEKAITEAEVLGASHGSIRMIRGLLALYRGDAHKAVEHLEQAVKLLPRSVAAHSLLAYAYGADGQYDRAEIVYMDSIEKLPAVTPEDYLFKGLVESAGGDASRGLETLDEAIRRRDSPIGRVVRSEARSYFAQDTGNIDMAQSAIDDAYVAKNMMPGNPQVIGIELWAHLVAMGVFRSAGEKDRADASLLQAGKDVQDLEQFSSHRHYTVSWRYLNLTGQEQAAHAVARKGYQEAESAGTRFIYVWSLYEQGEFEKALEAIESVGGPGKVSSHDAKSASGLYQFRPFILAELPDGYSRALQAHRENCGLFTKGYSAVFNQATLLLLGRRADAMAASRELYDHPEQLPDLSREHYLRILDYCGGGISAQELLRAETASRFKQCEAHFYVALDRLSQGDHAGAREHFQKAVATGVFSISEYDWSRLFLKRMDQDPTWPSWIPLKEPVSQPTTAPQR
jgi:tetratricopeptide (TPR) repeat protein